MAGLLGDGVEDGTGGDLVNRTSGFQLGLILKSSNSDRSINMKVGSLPAFSNRYHQMYPLKALSLLFSASKRGTRIGAEGVVWVDAEDLVVTPGGDCLAGGGLVSKSISPGVKERKSWRLKTPKCPRDS